MEVAPGRCRAVFTNILEFRGRGLVIQASRSGYRRAALILGRRFGPSPRDRPRNLLVPGSRLQTHGPAGTGGWASGDRPAALMEEHVPQAANGSASTRTRRAAASPGDVQLFLGPGAQYEVRAPSGVCPQNVGGSTCCVPGRRTGLVGGPWDAVQRVEEKAIDV